MAYLHHGRIQGNTWAIFPKIYYFHKFEPILSISQKGRTAVEWGCWPYPNANNKGCAP